MKPPVSSLVVGERVVSRCDDGLLEAEYALFDRSEVILVSGSGLGGRSAIEQGYLTTAGFARARLYESLVTADLAYEAFAAMRGRHVRPLARSHAVSEIVDQLGPYEAFQGGTFVAERGRYAGLWLDLDILATACPLRDAPILFQALHLVLVLEEVTEDVPVRLLTTQPEAEGRPGERTWRKVELEAAQRLPAVLREMQAPTRPHGSERDESDVREEILRDLRARAVGTAIAQLRLHTLAGAIARTGWTPPAGVLIEPAPLTKRMASGTPSPSARPTPPMPSAPPARPPSSRPPPAKVPPLALPTPLVDPRAEPDSKPIVDAHVDSSAAPNTERTGPTSDAAGSDPGALFATLRDQTDRLRGTDHLRSVAQTLTTLVETTPFVADLVVLAARAWLAAGEPGYARHFAKRIVDDPSIGDDLRIAALEILDAIPRSDETSRPPPIDAIQPSRVILLSELPDRAAPVGASLPPMAPVAPAEPVSVVAQATYEPPSSGRTVVAEAFVVPQRPRIAPPPGRPEIVETLALPAGLTEDMLPAGMIPRDLTQVRVAMTRLARQLGRDYRLTYGTALKTDLLAVDAMQRHLRRRFEDGPLDERHFRQLQVELTRHGALLSEILARVLGAQWTDVGHEEPGRWSMWVAPAVTVWPIGRVYRFYGQGHREADLVAFFMELEAGARRPG